MKWFKRKEPELSSVAKKILLDLDTPDLDYDVDTENLYYIIYIGDSYYIRLYAISSRVSIHNEEGVEIASFLPDEERCLIADKLRIVLHKIALKKDRERTAKVFNEN